MTEQAPQLKKDVVPSKYRDEYKQKGGTCGDFLGKRLQEIGKDGLPALQSIMKENGIPDKRWATMNPGQQRMNLSNVLRSRFLNGEDVHILGKQHNVNHMADDYGRDRLDKDKPDTIAKFAEAHELQTNDRTVKALIKTFFPPEKRVVKTAEQKAAEKAEAEKHKAEAKQQKADAAAKAKQDKADAKQAKADAAAKAKQDKADAAAAAKDAKADKAAKADKVKEPA